MKKIVFLAAMVMIGFASCSEAETNQNAANDGKTVEFRPLVEKTRASQVASSAELVSFFVQADVTGDDDFSFLKASVYKDQTNGWTYSPKKYWPTAAGATVDFYAYSPVKDVNMTTDLAIASGVVTFGYTVPLNQSVNNTATDLLVASVPAQNATSAAGTVTFPFTHALSGATFSATNRNASTSELVYVISKIELTNLGNVATYTYGTGFAAPAAAASTYVAGVPASGVAVLPSRDLTNTNGVAVNLLSANDIMMVLPQTPVIANAKVKITFSLKQADGSFVFENAERTFDYPAAFAFAPANIYNFSFVFLDVATDPNIIPIVFDTTLTGWTGPTGTDVVTP